MDYTESGASEHMGSICTGTSEDMDPTNAGSSRNAVSTGKKHFSATDSSDENDSFDDFDSFDDSDTSDDPDDPDIGYEAKMMDKFFESAVVSDAEAPVDVKSRMETILQRLREEYKFNMSEYNIKREKKVFKKISDPNSKSKRLFDTLCKAPADEDLKSIDTEFYGEGLTRSVLLRSCYFDMFELILDSLKIPSGNNWYLILGSTGIGKSWFHVFCLHVLIKAEIPVFIQRMENSALFFKGEVYECSDVKDNILLTQSNIWWLYDCKVDPHEIMSPDSICVMVSPPKRESYKEYAKLCHFGRMYMPQWKYQELKRANRLWTPATSRLARAVLKKRFKLCGGIPRHIFDKYKNYKKQLWQDVGAIRIEQLDSQQFKDLGHVLNNVFGLKVTGNYFDAEVDFLSERIAEEVTEVLVKTSKLSLSKLLHQVLYRTTDVIGGHVHKILAIKQLVPGFTLSFESLGTENLENIVLPNPLNKHRLKGITLDNVDWSSSDATLWVPKNGDSFPCIDCFLLLPHENGKDNIALGVQITVGSRHPVPRDPLAAMIELCRSNGFSFKLVYALTHERNYDAFKRQKQTVNGKVVETEDEVHCPQFKVDLIQ